MENTTDENQSDLKPPDYSSYPEAGPDFSAYPAEEPEKPELTFARAAGAPVVGLLETMRNSAKYVKTFDDRAWQDRINRIEANQAKTFKIDPDTGESQPIQSDFLTETYNSLGEKDKAEVDLAISDYVNQGYSEEYAMSQSMMDKFKSNQEHVSDVWSSIERAIGEIPEEYVGKSSGFMEDVLRAGGQLGWNMGAGVIASIAAGPVMGSALSVGLMYPMVAGAALQDLEQQGADPDTAWKFANLDALAQTPVEFLGNAFVFSRWLKLNGTLGQFATKVMQSFLGEGTEEFVQSYEEQILMKAALNPDLRGPELASWIAHNIDDMTPQALYEGAVGGILGAAGMTASGAFHILVHPRQKALNDTKFQRAIHLLGKVSKDEISASESSELANLLGVHEDKIAEAAGTDMTDMFGAIADEVAGRYREAEPIESPERNAFYEGAKQAMGSDKAEAYLHITDAMARARAEREGGIPSDYYKEVTKGFVPAEFVKPGEEASLEQAIPYEQLSEPSRAKVDEVIESHPDSERITQTIARLKGTPWEKEATASLLTRSAIDDILAGKNPDDYEHMLSAPEDSDAPTHVAIRNFRKDLETRGAEAIWDRLKQKGFIGHPSKPINAINGSYINCEPSKACANFCYAARGRNYRTNIVKQEMINWAIDNDPVRAANMASEQYKALPEFKANKALRLLDKGDLNENWIPFVAELNKQGIRAQIFSKKPELLRQISDKNLRLLSIDKSNQDMAEQNRDLNIAVVYEDESQLPFLEEHKDHIGVILPVVDRGKVLNRGKVNALPAWAKKHLCPIDSGVKKIEKGWSCTKCDSAAGLPGCFFNASTKKINAFLFQEDKRKPLQLNEGAPEEIKPMEQRFEELATAQRGAPEKAMLKVQRAAGGGILGWVAEHAGDLTHRMAQTPSFFRGGYEWVKPKVDLVYRVLHQRYGFEKEYRENIEGNARLDNEPVDEKQARVDEALQKYADEHRKLTTYNNVQTMARDLAVAIGEQRWDDARWLSSQLKKYTDLGAETWEKLALSDSYMDRKGETVTWQGEVLYQEPPQIPRFPITITALTDPMIQSRRGKNIKVETIRQVLNQKHIKQIEKEIVESVLEMPGFKGQKSFSADEFITLVEAELMPTQKISTTAYNDYGASSAGFDPDEAETIIHNSPITHGYTGHFHSLFHKEDIQTNWEIVPVPQRPDLFVALDANRPQTQDPEVLANYLGTAGTRERVEAWIDEYKHRSEEGRINRGLIGHIRRWFLGDDTFLAELQSDYYQKNNAVTDLSEQIINGERIWTDQQQELAQKYQDANSIIQTMPATIIQSYTDAADLIEEINQRNKDLKDDLKTLAGLEEQFKHMTTEQTANEIKPQVKDRINYFKTIRIPSMEKLVNTSKEMLKNMAAWGKPSFSLITPNTFFMYAKQLQLSQATAETAKAINSGLKEREAIMATSGNTWSEKDDEELADNLYGLLRQDKDHSAYRKWHETNYTRYYQAKKDILDIKTKEIPQTFTILQKQFVAHRKNYTERMLREEIRQAALDGKENLFIPAPRTSAIIEGFVSLPRPARERANAGENVMYEVTRGNPDHLEIGDTIDYLDEEWTIFETDDESIHVVPTQHVSSFHARDFINDEINNRYENDFYELPDDFEIWEIIPPDENQFQLPLDVKEPEEPDMTITQNGRTFGVNFGPSRYGGPDEWQTNMIKEAIEKHGGIEDWWDERDEEDDTVTISKDEIDNEIYDMISDSVEDEFDDDDAVAERLGEYGYNASAVWNGYCYTSDHDTEALPQPHMIEEMMDDEDEEYIEDLQDTGQGEPIDDDWTPANLGTRQQTIINKYVELKALLQKMRGDNFFLYRHESGTLWYGTKIEPEDGTNPSIVFQPGEDGTPLGAFNIHTRVINAFQNADIHTALHEMAHARFQEMMQEKDADYYLLADWAGVSKKNAEAGKWTQAQLEKIARGFEAYMMEGKAPTNKLQDVFSRIRQWMTQIYQNIKALDVEMSDEVRAVFDRWVAIDQSVVEDPTMNVNEWLKADKIEKIDINENSSIDDIEAAARANVLTRIKGKRAEREKRVKAALKDRARTTIESYPIFEMIDDIKESGGLDINVLYENYDKEIVFQILKRIPGLLKKEGGQNPIQFMGKHGYDDLDIFVNDIIGAPKKSDSINEYFDALWDDYLKGTVTEANDIYRQVIDEQVKLLNKLANIVPDKRGIKNIIREKTGQISDPEYKQLVADFNRDQQLSRQAFRAGKKEEAARLIEKNRERIEKIYRHKKEQAERVAIKKRIQRYVKSKSMLPEFKAQIANFAKDYVAVPPSRVIPVEEPLDVFLSRFESEDGYLVTAIRDELVDRPTQEYTEKGNRVPLTIDQLRVVDRITSMLAHMAKNQKTVRIENQKRDINAAVDEMVGVAYESHRMEPQEVEAAPHQKRGLWEKLGRGRAAYLAQRKKVEFILSELDGFNDDGPNYKLFHMIKMAEDQEFQLGEIIWKQIQQAFKDFRNKGWALEKFQIPGKTNLWTKENLVMAALNMGNEGNVKALMEGYKLTEEQIVYISDLLTEKEWDLVHSIWRIIDQIYPHLNAVHRELTGVNLPKVEGSYFPLVFDRELSWRAAEFTEESDLRNMFASPYTRPSVEAGHRKARKGGKLAPLLSFSVISKHITNAVHDASHQVPVRTVQRLISQPKYRAAITEVMGEEAYKQLTPWLHDIARPYREPQTLIEKIFSRVRKNSTIVSLGVKFSVAAKQLLSITQTVDEATQRIGQVKGMYEVARAMSEIYTDAIGSAQKIRWIKEQSPMMRNRRRQWDRDLNQFAAHFDPSNFGNLEMAKDVFFAMIGAMDAVATYPTWLAGYNIEMQQSGDHEKAVHAADRMVRRTQPVASPKDLNYLQRGGQAKSELHKVFTMFYTFFSVFDQRMMETSAKIKLGNIGIGKAALSYWWILVLPAFLGSIIQRRRLPEGWEWFKDVIGYRLAALPFVRDVFNPMITGFDYTMTPVESAFEVPYDVYKAVTSKHPKGRTITKELLKGAGYAVGLPSSQAVTTMDGVLDLIEGKTSDPTAILFRKEKSKKRRLK